MPQLWRQVHGKRFSGTAAVVMAILEAVGIATLFSADKPIVLLGGFVIFVLLVLWHVTALYNELEDRDELLSNHRRARWIASELGARLIPAKTFFTHTTPMNKAAIDEWVGNVEHFLRTTPELGPAYLARFSNSSNIDYGPLPDELTAHPERKAAWYSMKTKLARLDEFIQEWLRRADGITSA